MCNYEKKEIRKRWNTFSHHYVFVCILLYFPSLPSQHCTPTTLSHRQSQGNRWKSSRDSSSVSKLAHQLPTKQFDLFVWKRVVFRPKQHCFKQHLLRQSLHLKRVQMTLEHFFTHAPVLTKTCKQNLLFKSNKVSLYCQTGVPFSVFRILEETSPGFYQFFSRIQCDIRRKNVLHSHWDPCITKLQWLLRWVLQYFPMNGSFIKCLSPFQQ